MVSWRGDFGHKSGSLRLEHSAPAHDDCLRADILPSIDLWSGHTQRLSNSSILEIDRDEQETSSSAREVGRATQAYQRATDGFDDEVGRQLELNSSDFRCLEWLTERAR